MTGILSIEQILELPTFKFDNLPSFSGVYFVTNSGNEIIYIGLSSCIKRRWGQHPYKKILVKNDHAVRCLKVRDDWRELNEIEGAHIAHYRPKYNNSRVPKIFMERDPGNTHIGIVKRGIRPPTIKIPRIRISMTDIVTGKSKDFTIETHTELECLRDCLKKYLLSPMRRQIQQDVMEANKRKETTNVPREAPPPTSGNPSADAVIANAARRAAAGQT